jgi:hypothetical protein
LVATQIFTKILSPAHQQHAAAAELTGSDIDGVMYRTMVNGLRGTSTSSAYLDTSISA